MERKIFTRGTVCESAEDAFKRKLNLSNKSHASVDQEKWNIPPGVYFGNSTEDEDLSIAEDFANRVSEREGKEPVVIKVELDPVNFPVVSGNLHNVIIDLRKMHFPNDHSYKLPGSFEEISSGQINGQITIDMSQLTPSDLVSLRTEVGFKGIDGKFQYKRVSVDDF